MKNLDLIQQKKAEIMVKMNQAIKDGNEEDFSQAFTDYTDMLQEAVMSEAKGLVQSSDNTILAGRGVRVLTSQETNFYEKLITGMKTGNIQQSLTEFDVVLPKTVIDSVFEDITEAHPLLDAINFMPTGPLVEILVSVQDGRHLATWDTLTAAIATELTAGFSKIDLSQKKLSAFIPIGKAMLDLGPAWLDRYIRTILSEAIANGLEKGIINGTGVNQPCGMRRDPNSALHPTNGYELLVAVPFSSFTPENYGGILASLAVAPTGLYRTISEVLLIVNPVDYFTKVMPASVFQRQDGSYVTNIFPFPTRVIQSVWVPANEAIIGLGKRYFMALGTGKGGKIEYSDEYRFLEDERVYLTKLYGNGKPLDSTSFKRLNITNLKPVYPIMRTKPFVDATLAGLKVANGAVEISPAFNSAIHYYTAETGNATDLVTATVKDGEATITATLNGTAEDLANALTWVEGQNVVVITVTKDTEMEAYVLAVTHTA
ncbi:phage major capsid protein [Sporomusa sp. KB1]|uniref:phage major capsid protein n=1 Tax=Sporomusa sp. KB1 TaxID=943346 RepID=UPI0011A8A30D|nr:phage major capsid protein [Sporomusa sp. KB1]TWH49599.1 HK97 family phage major capsid protein [Sporomusa sp. KB1]